MSRTGSNLFQQFLITLSRFPLLVCLKTNAQPLAHFPLTIFYRLLNEPSLLHSVIEPPRGKRFLAPLLAAVLVAVFQVCNGHGYALRLLVRFREYTLLSYE